MKEKEFEKEVKSFLRDHGCWVLKTWSNGIQREGVPDLLVCCNGYFLGIELKTETGKASELQKWNIRKIKEAGGFACVLRPSQFESFKKCIMQMNHNINCRHTIAEDEFLKEKDNESLRIDK